MPRPLQALLALAMLLATFGRADARATAGWLGDGSARYPNAAAPLAFGPARAIRWSAELPDWANASPVVSGDRVFVTAEPATLLCLSLADGRELWRHVATFIDTVPASERATARAEMARADALSASLRAKEKQYARLKRDLRKARLPPAQARAELDRMTAEVSTLKDQLRAHDRFRAPDPIPLMGAAAATPVTDGRHVYGVFGNGVVVALNLEGQLQWARFLGKPLQTMRGYHRGSAASPLLVDGTLVVAMNHLHGLDPADGSSRWEGEPYLDYGAPQAVEVGGRWYVATPSGDVVRVSDGEEVLDGVGSVYFNTPAVAGSTLYFVGAFADPDSHDRQALAVRLQASGASLARTELWRTRLTPEKTYGCPLVDGGLAYTLGARGTMTALDTTTGAVVWEQRLDLGSDDVMSSPVLAGGRLVVGGLSGRLAVVRAGRTFERLGGGELEPTRATPSFAAGLMLFRGTERLWAVEAAP